MEDDFSGVVVKQDPRCDDHDGSNQEEMDMNANDDEESSRGEKRSYNTEDDQNSLSSAKRTRVDDNTVNGNSSSNLMCSLGNTVDDDDQYLYSDELAENTQSSDTYEYPTPSDTLESCGLPLNIDQLMQNIYDWDPETLKKPDETIVKSKLQRNLKNMLSVFTYPSIAVFKVVNIPLILFRFYRKLRAVKLNRRHAKYLDCSVIVKCHNTLTNTLEMRCIFMRKPTDDPQLSFGNLVELRTVSQRKPNNPKVHVSNRSYFGYVRFVFRSRKINLKSQSELNHLQLFEENDRNKVLVDEFIVETKLTNELYSRSDFLLRMDILTNMFFYVHQARTVYDMQKYRIHSQFLRPQLRVRACGLCIEVDPSKYTNEQLDAIQKCVDVVCNVSQDPYFVCLKSTESSKTLEVMNQIIKQLLSFVGQVKLLPTKILIAAKIADEIGKLHSFFKNYFNVCCVGSSEFQKQVVHDCKLLIKEKIKDIEEKEDMDARPHKKVEHKNLKQCMEYLRSLGTSNIVQLSPSPMLYIKNILGECSRKLLHSSDLIIGTLEDLCSDSNFYSTFKSTSRSGEESSGQKIMCCFVYEADLFTEPEVMSFLHFGIEKFILCSSTVSNEQHNEHFLNRSLFSRLCDYSRLLKCDTSTSSIIEFNSAASDV